MMDLFLETWVSSIIEGKKVQWTLGRGKSWQPGEQLKLLFAGYNGTRNTGADARVEEMLEQHPDCITFTSSILLPWCGTQRTPNGTSLSRIENPTMCMTYGYPQRHSGA